MLDDRTEDATTEYSRQIFGDDRVPSKDNFSGKTPLFRDPRLAEFGRRLRQVREELGVSRSVVAREVGIAENTLYRYEKGHSRPRNMILEKLSELYRCPIAWLDGSEEEDGFRQWGAYGPELGPDSEVPAVVGSPIRTPRFEVVRSVSIGSARRGWFPPTLNWFEPHDMGAGECCLSGSHKIALGGLVSSSDMVLADPGRTDLRDGHVYVLKTPDRSVVVRRVMRHGDWWGFTSNSDTAPMQIDASVAVLGEVQYVVQRIL